MKKIILNLSLILSCFTAFAQIPTNGLVAYYPFNGNANDKSGSGYNGTVISASLTTNRNGNPNTAYYFNGNKNGGISISNFKVNFKTYTISMWVNRDSITSTQIQSRLFSNYNSGLPAICAYIEWGNNHVFGVSNKYSSGGPSDLYTPKPLPPNTWYHYTISWGNNLLKIYQNGVLVASSNIISYDLKQTISDFMIGGDVNDTAHRYFGKIDDIRIYNRVLDSDEISLLYNEVECLTNLPKPTFADVNKCYDTTTIYSFPASNGFSNKWYDYNNDLIYSGTNFTTKLTRWNNGYYNGSRDTICKCLVSNILDNCESTKDTVIFNIKARPYVYVNSAHVSYPNLIYVNSDLIYLTLNPTGGILKLNDKIYNSTTFNPQNNGLGKKNFTYSMSSINGCSNSSSFNFTVYDTVHCVNGTDTLIIKSNTTSGINLPSNFGVVKLYPNPTNNILNISVSNPSSNYRINILNNLSQSINSFIMSDSSYQINLSNLPRGLYYVQITDLSSNVLETKKLLLE